MSSNLHIIFNEPVTDQQVNELLDVIITWVEAHNLTIFAVAGEEHNSEEVGDVKEI